MLLLLQVQFQETAAAATQELQAQRSSEAAGRMAAEAQRDAANATLAEVVPQVAAIHVNV